MKLSICTITYNHGRYIEQALDSFVSQRTDFDFEIIVSDDCSTDNTVELIRPYLEKYPGKIRLLTHSSNIGMIPNFKGAIDACVGQYVALCEGDDYWLYDEKLQKQVDLLDRHPEISICFHKAQLLFDGVEPFNFDDINRFTKQVSTFDDLVNGNFIHTPTVVYRNHLFGKYPQPLLKYKFGDWPLHLLNAQKGNIWFIPEEWSVYRITPSGAWSTRSRIHKIAYTVQFLSSIKHYFGKEHETAFSQSIRNYYKYLVKLNAQARQYWSGIKTFFRFLNYSLTGK